MPWGTFWRLLEQLSSDSRFIKAQLDDPDVAARLVAKESEDDPPWRPRSADFTLMHELVAEVRDLLGEVTALLADLPVGVKTRHKPPAPFLRPMSEVDKARAKAKQEKDQAYDDRIDTLTRAAQKRWREQHPDG